MKLNIYKGIIKGKWIEKISPYIALFSLLLSVVFFSLNYSVEEKPNLTYDIITNSKLLNLDNNDLELKFKYDSLQFSSKTDQISLIVIKIKNLGNKNILIDDFDKNFPFGLRLKDSEIIQTPEIINSTNENYYSNVIENFNRSEIIFRKKIFDINESFNLKFYAKHNHKNEPIIEPVGKITGQQIFTINSAEDINTIIEKQRRELNLNKMTTGLSIALIIILSLLTLSLYKNNNLRAKANNLLYEKISELEKRLKRNK